MQIEVISCADCGNVGLNLIESEDTGHRLTDHKCSGRWKVIKVCNVTDDRSLTRLRDYINKELKHVATGNNSSPLSTPRKPRR